jgi:hypothetical protein
MFKPIMFPHWVSTWWLQAVFFVLFASLAVAFSFLRPIDGWLLVGIAFSACAALLSLYAAIMNRTRRRPGPVASWMFLLFPLIFMILLAVKFVIRSGET